MAQKDFFVPVGDINPETLVKEDFRRTVGALLCGIEPPVSVSQTLLTRKQPLTAHDIAGISGRDYEEVEHILSSLESTKWVLRLTDDGFDKFMLDPVRIRQDISD